MSSQDSVKTDIVLLPSIYEVQLLKHDSISNTKLAQGQLHHSSAEALPSPLHNPITRFITYTTYVEAVNIITT